MLHSGLVPLHNACSYGHYEVAELLVIHGAVVNVADLWKFTPLHEAAAKGKYEICKLLLQVLKSSGWNQFLRLWIEIISIINGSKVMEEALCSVLCSLQYNKVIPWHSMVPTRPKRIVMETPLWTWWRMRIQTFRICSGVTQHCWTPLRKAA